MEASPVNHPSADVLRRLSAGRLDGATAAAVIAHLDACPRCQAALISAEGRLFDRHRTAYPASVITPDAPGADTRAAPAPPDGLPTEQGPVIPPQLRDHPQYEVLRELGRGGMGVVYLARNRLMARLEVLKVVNPQLLHQPDLSERFRREIRSAAQLRHPNIVTAYAALPAGDGLVFAMEYVEGDDLGKVVKERGPLPVVNACCYARQVALGLQHAFEKGLVHRDIKPSNLILTRGGEGHVVKILDFGLARVTREQDATGHGLTGTGQVLGTPDYMAPEQSEDATRADVRADVYSLGCTLYFLLTGTPPFRAKGLYGLLQAHAGQEATPVHQVRPEVPAEVAAVVAKMMAKDPARRYPEPIAVARALAPFVRDPGEPLAETAPAPEAMAKPAARGRGQSRAATAASRWRGVAVAGVGVLLLAGAIGLWAGGAFRPAIPGQSEEGGTGGRSAGPTAPPGGPKAADGDIAAKVKNVSGIELVSIPAGEFAMGSRADDKDAEDDEKPRHKVTISRPFSLGKYKVTVGQFQRFVAATGHRSEAEKAGDARTWKAPGFDQTGEHPVVYVSWHDADAFCRWLATESGAQVRLPREAEWEYCCRAKTTTRFSFGDDEADLGNSAWYGKNTDRGTHPCGLKKPNDFGLYDMHGLAWEWCADGLRTYKDQEETDPEGAGTSQRVYRGGSWNGVARVCRAAFRMAEAPSIRVGDLGFRVLVSR